MWSSQFLKNCGCCFAANRSLLKLLFKSASQAILDWAQTENFRPGVVTVLHTFGSDLKFNCHIHALYTLGGIDTRTGCWRSREYLSAKSIKQRFKTIFLSGLRQARTTLVIPPGVRQIWLAKFKTTNLYHVQNQLWKMEWFNWVGEKLDNADFTTKYIGRYAKRPCLSEAKIKYYSKREFITVFEYKDKITKEFVQKEINPISLIGRLVRHIPEKNFHMIRYYGAYSNPCRNKIFLQLSQHLIAAFGVARLLFEPNYLTWRQRIEKSTGSDPLSCPNCGKSMLISLIVYRTRDGTMKTVSF